VTVALVTTLVENCRKKPTLPCKQWSTKTQTCWKNKWCQKALCNEL